MRILVADNHNEFRRSLIEYVQSRRDLHVVAEVRDGVQAVRMATRTRPDLVIINVKLPKLDAWTTAKAIKLLHPRTHVIALSLGDTREEERLGPESAVEVLLKQDQIARELPRVIERIRSEII